MKENVKEIKEHVARAKAYANKYDIVRSLGSLCDALRVLTTSQVVGREKFEIEILINEVLATLSGMSQLKSIFPNGISLKKGQEKPLLKRLSVLHAKIKEAIENAEREKMRAYKVSIDKAILGAQKLLDKGDEAEAKKAFRKAADKFSKEPGVFQDVGSRMLKGGLIQESIEYLEAAIEQDPRDARPYGYLVTALEGLGELEKAEEVTKDALRNFGPNDRTYLILARLYMQMKKWDEAYDAAKAALDHNEFCKEAKKIMDKVAPRIFGKGGKKEKKTYTFNM